MSRSVKKTPVQSNATASSEKQDKQIWHQRLRHLEKQKLSQSTDLEAYVPVSEHEVSDPRSMAKDGRHFVTGSQLAKAVARAKKLHPEDARAGERAVHKLVAK